jgi:hypothetical protein
VLNKFTSVTLVAAMVVVLCGTSAFANNSSVADEKTDAGSVPVTKVVKPNERLKNNIEKLVADAKAGKVALPTKSQIQPAKSNGWSKGTKIAVGVGIAAAVIVTILIVSPAFNDGQ